MLLNALVQARRDETAQLVNLIAKSSSVLVQHTEGKQDPLREDEVGKVGQAPLILLQVLTLSAKLEVVSMPSYMMRCRLSAVSW